jgi:hypothetical protein
MGRPDNYGSKLGDYLKRLRDPNLVYKRSLSLNTTSTSALFRSTAPTFTGKSSVVMQFDCRFESAQAPYVRASLLEEWLNGTKQVLSTYRVDYTSVSEFSENMDLAESARESNMSFTGAEAMQLQQLVVSGGREQEQQRIVAVYKHPANKGWLNVSMTLYPNVLNELFFVTESVDYLYPVSVEGLFVVLRGSFPNKVSNSYISVNHTYLSATDNYISYPYVTMDLTYTRNHRTFPFSGTMDDQTGLATDSPYTDIASFLSSDNVCYQASDVAGDKCFYLLSNFRNDPKSAGNNSFITGGEIGFELFELTAERTIGPLLPKEVVSLKRAYTERTVNVSIAKGDPYTRQVGWSGNTSHYMLTSEAAWETKRTVLRFSAVRSRPGFTAEYFFYRNENDTTGEALVPSYSVQLLSVIEYNETITANHSTSRWDFDPLSTTFSNFSLQSSPVSRNTSDNNLTVHIDSTYVSPESTKTADNIYSLHIMASISKQFLLQPSLELRDTIYRGLYSEEGLTVTFNTVNWPLRYANSSLAFRFMVTSKHQLSKATVVNGTKGMGVLKTDSQGQGLLRGVYAEVTDYDGDATEVVTALEIVSDAVTTKAVSATAATNVSTVPSTTVNGTVSPSNSSVTSLVAATTSTASSSAPDATTTSLPANGPVTSWFEYRAIRPRAVNDRLDLSMALELAFDVANVNVARLNHIFVDQVDVAVVKPVVNKNSATSLSHKLPTLWLLGALGMLLV